MKIIKVKDYSEMSKLAAEFVSNAILNKPNIVLGFATGSTPEGMYKELISNKKINWESVTTFNLDEYIGLRSTHPLSYHFYMNVHLFNHIDIKKINTYVPNGINKPEVEGKIYEEFITSKGGIDLQILGIGENGHIAFNEPGTDPASVTGEVQLTHSTIKANSRFFDSIDDVPKKAMSMGLSTIMKAKGIILLASGSNKADALKKSVRGEVTKEVPGSFLQNHNNVIVIADEAAAKYI